MFLLLRNTGTVVHFESNTHIHCPADKNTLEYYNRFHPLKNHENFWAVTQTEIYLGLTFHKQACHAHICSPFWYGDGAV